MVRTFDGKEWERDDILPLMDNDEFYYGYLGQNALSSSSFKTILTDFDEYLLSARYPQAVGPRAKSSAGL